MREPMPPLPTDAAVALAPPDPGAGDPGVVGALPSAEFVHWEPDSVLETTAPFTLLPQALTGTLTGAWMMLPDRMPPEWSVVWFAEEPPPPGPPEPDGVPPCAVH